MMACFTLGAGRGGRYPAGAHAVAVSAALRLRCGAHSGLAPRNSLRSLRSLRSNNLGESDERSARVRAPSPELRSSPPQKSPLPGTTHRTEMRVVFGEKIGASAKPRAGVRRRRHMRRRGTQGSWPRAQRASTSDSWRLSERSERSVRSEFRHGPRERVPQGTPRAARGCRIRAPAHTRPRLCSLHRDQSSHPKK